jgi:hypothetical protein
MTEESAGLSRRFCCGSGNHLYRIKEKGNPASLRFCGTMPDGSIG